METIIRVLKNLDADPFARIDKIPINDPLISYKAKGILTYVLSKPDGWEVNITDLDSHATDGEKSIRAGISELIKLKYCQRVKTIEPVTKRIKKWVYCFYERPYSGDVLELVTIEEDPEPQNGNVAPDPDCRFPHVEKPHVEKPHVENGPLNNKVVKQQSIKVTKEGNNNNNGRGVGAGKNIIIISEKIKHKRKFNKIKESVLLMGWVGPLDEIVKYHNENPKRVEAWVEYISGIEIENRAGLLRKSLRSGETVRTKADQELADRKGYITDPFAGAIEP